MLQVAVPSPAPSPQPFQLCGKRRAENDAAAEGCKRREAASGLVAEPIQLRSCPSGESDVRGCMRPAWGVQEAIGGRPYMEDTHLAGVSLGCDLLAGFSSSAGPQGADEHHVAGQDAHVRSSSAAHGAASAHTSGAAAPGATLFAVFDGHGGTSASAFLQKYAASALQSALQAKPQDPAAACASAFDALHEQLTEKHGQELCGSTATVVVVDEKHIVCANAGGFF